MPALAHISLSSFRSSGRSPAPPTMSIGSAPPPSVSSSCGSNACAITGSDMPNELLERPGWYALRGRRDRLGSRHPIARGRSASLRAIGASSTALASTGFSSTGIQSKRASFSTTFSSPSCGSATSPLSGSGTGASSCGSATSPSSGSGTGVSSCVCEPVSDSV